MTKSEKEKLVRELHRDLIGKLIRNFNNELHNAVEQAAASSEMLRPGGIRFVEPYEREAGYTLSRERSSWSPNEEAILRNELDAAIKMIAIAHRRTPGGITSRLRKLGILTDYSLTGL